jgi:hypothetical protein
MLLHTQLIELEKLEIQSHTGTHLIPIRFGKLHSRRAALDPPTVNHDVNLATHEFKGAIEDGLDGLEVRKITDGNVGTST